MTQYRSSSYHIQMGPAPTAAAVLGWFMPQAFVLQIGASAGAVPKGGPRKHIISVSTYQMVILMLFNSREKLTYEVSKKESFAAVSQERNHLRNVILPSSTIVSGLVEGNWTANFAKIPMHFWTSTL